MTVRRLHRLIAWGLGAFIILHLANHLTILIGTDTHLKTMAVLRIFYRPLLAEIALLGLLSTQIVLGFTMMRKRGWPKNLPARVQYISGIAFAFFVIQHVGAAVVTRVLAPDLDTNVYWAASVVSRVPFVWYFAPYYAVGVMSLFVHVGMALYQRVQYRHLAKWILGAGVVTTFLIVAGFMGLLNTEIILPTAYEEYLDQYWARLW